MKPFDDFRASAARLSRRCFLGAVGVGAAGAATALRIDLLLGTQAEAAPLSSGLPEFPGAFGRLFPELPPFAPAQTLYVRRSSTLGSRVGCSTPTTTSARVRLP
jgi:hypothetical protein